MKKNVTIKLDDRLLKQSRHAAIEDDKSLSEWVADLIASEITERHSVSSSRRSAIRYLKEGLNLGGKPLSRDQTHER